MKKVIFFFAFILIAFAKEVYFMPMDGEIAHKRLFYLLSHAHKNIKMTIYTFTDKKLARALKIAANKGVQVTIIADKKEAKYKYSVIPNLATIKNIKIKLLSGKSYKNGDKAKMHVKLTIIDNKYLIIGSANYSYSAFYKNYEYVVIEKDKELIGAFNTFFEKLKHISTSYRLSNTN